jgi:hypothetical protein
MEMRSTPGAEELPQDRLEKIYELIKIGAAPEVISSSLGISPEIIESILSKDPQHITRTVELIQMESQIYRCALSQRLMVNPVKDRQGTCYELSFVEAHASYSRNSFKPIPRLRTKVIKFSKRSLRELESFLKHKGLPDSIIVLTAECLAVLSSSDEQEAVFQLMHSVKEDTVKRIVRKLVDLVPEEFLISLMLQLMGETAKAFVIAKLLILETKSPRAFEQGFLCFIRLLYSSTLPPGIIELAEQISGRLNRDQLDLMNKAFKTLRVERELEDRMDILMVTEDSFRMEVSLTLQGPGDLLSLEELLTNLRSPVTEQGANEVLGSVHICESLIVLKEAFAKLKDEHLPEKWRLAEILLKQAQFLRGEERDDKLQESVYYIAVDGDVQYSQKPTANEGINEAFWRFNAESLEIDRDPELCTILGYLFKNWTNQIQSKSQKLISKFNTRLMSMTALAESGLLLQIFELPRLAKDLMSHVECRPTKKTARKALNERVVLYRTKLEAFIAAIREKTDTWSNDQTALNAFWFDVEITILASKKSRDPFAKLFPLIKTQFVERLVSIARQAVTSVVNEVDFEYFDGKRAKTSNLLEMVMHLKAELVNPRNRQNIAKDMQLREEVYSMLAKLWSSKVVVHAGLLDHAGTNKVQFISEDEFATFDVDGFINDVCRITTIDRADILVEGIERGCTIINVIIDGGMSNINKLDKNAQQLPVYAIKIGDFEVKLGSKCLNSDYNKTYGPHGTFWEGALEDEWERGPDPYFCPVGWKRFSIKVSDFDETCTGWSVTYHGTSSENTASILTKGLKLGGGAFLEPNEKSVYFSPCIEYCAHPRYATLNKPAGREYLQVVLQCRVNPEAITARLPETLLNDKSIQVHPDYDNDELEWLIVKPPESQDYLVWGRDVVCYGIMVRISKTHPRELPVSSWWKWTDLTG